MTPIHIIVAGVLIVLASLAGAIASGDTIKTVRHDLGGNIGDRLGEMHSMRGVVIDGICASSCTLYLGLPDTCVTRRAKLGFHGPNLPSGRKMGKTYFDGWTGVMAEQYPPAIAEWFMAEARHSTALIYIKAEQAVRLGVKPCGGGA